MLARGITGFRDGRLCKYRSQQIRSPNPDCPIVHLHGDWFGTTQRLGSTGSHHSLCSATGRTSYTSAQPVRDENVDYCSLAAKSMSLSTRTDFDRKATFF